MRVSIYILSLDENEGRTNENLISSDIEIVTFLTKKMSNTFTPITPLFYLESSLSILFPVTGHFLKSKSFKSTIKKTKPVHSKKNKSTISKFIPDRDTTSRNSLDPKRENSPVKRERFSS